MRINSIEQRIHATEGLISVIDQLGNGLYDEKDKPTKETIKTAIRRVSYLRYWIKADLNWLRKQKRKRTARQKRSNPMARQRRL